MLYERDLLPRVVAVSAGDDGDAAYLGETQTERDAARKQLDEVLHEWITSAHRAAPMRAAALVHQGVMHDATHAPALLARMDRLDHTFVHVLEKKARVAGEVAGLRQALDLTGAHHGPAALEELVLREYASEDALGPALLRTAALVVASADEPSPRLLDYLCWIPAKFGAFSCFPHPLRVLTRACSS